VSAESARRAGVAVDRSRICPRDRRRAEPLRGDQGARHGARGGM